MKKIAEEFKKFITRGNVIDMAVGIIIGSAFTSIVTSFVEDIINPVIGIFGGMNFDKYCIPLAGEATLNYGKFLTSVIHFLIVALVLFFIMKSVNAMTEKLTKKEELPKKIKKCTYCKSEIDEEATRCPHCTSVLTD